MKTPAAIALAAIFLSSAAWAAAPSENVTVTAAKFREMIDKFTTAATPARVTGKVVRWDRRVCPVVVGQNASFTAFITQRVKVIAQAVRAPVETSASCTPNIQIIFTTTPQALVDSVRGSDPEYLGYAASPAELEALAKVTRPIQAWYTVETIDLDGQRTLDSGMPLGEGIKTGSTARPIFVPKVTRSNGNLINDGIHSGFNHILIVIDSTKLTGQKIVPLADYISLLALTQLSSPDACQQLPSIANMMATDCDRAADGLTQYDLAYLQGLYRISTGRRIALQRDDIADAMMNALADMSAAAHTGAKP